MIILDLFETDSWIEPEPKGYSSEKDDQTVLKLSDLRKTRLTLAQLNRIRKLNDVKKLEHTKKADELHKQYGAAPADEGM